MTTEEKLARIAKLDREIANASQWGAGIAVRDEERQALKRQVYSQILCDNANARQKWLDQMSWWRRFWTSFWYGY